MGIKYTLFLIICVAATVIVTLNTAPLFFTDPLHDKPDNRPLTQQDGKAILKQLADIQSTLQRVEKESRAGKRPPTPKTASASTSGRPVLGSPDAGITVIEFTDYQCPFCSRFEKTTFKQLKKSYVDTGKIRWVVLDMPLDFHKESMQASRAAHCAAEQGKFWQLRELFFNNQNKLQAENLTGYARQAGIDTEAFKLCLDSNRYQDAIERDIAEAEKQGITGTPTFIIGKTTGDVITGRRIIGAQAYRTFSNEIEALLRAGPVKTN